MKTIVDVRDYRLELARKMGADYCINTNGMEEKDVIDKIKSHMGCEPHCSFDAAGATQCVRIACQVKNYLIPV